MLVKEASKDKDEDKEEVLVEDATTLSVITMDWHDTL